MTFLHKILWHCAKSILHVHVPFAPGMQNEAIRAHDDGIAFDSAGGTDLIWFGIWPLLDENIWCYILPKMICKYPVWS